MSQHFIDDIKIENFKCFENLEITGFKRVNLFGGKNNVGKTALLESLQFLALGKTPNLLVLLIFTMLKQRQHATNDALLKMLEMDIFRGFSNKFSIRSSIRKIVVIRGFNYTPTNKDVYSQNFGEGISFIVDDEAVQLPINIFHVDGTGQLPFYPSDRDIIPRNVFLASRSTLDEKGIASLYGAVVELEKEGFLDQSLAKFDGNIISFKVVPTERGVRAKLKLNGRDSLALLSEMGDGINRYIAILCAIWASHNGFLFVDEIENGIHYSNYKKLWELVFMASEQANCQVFVTSHSKECIEAFNQVQLDRSDNTGMYFELYHSERKKRIVAAGRDAEQLHYSLTHGAAIRGE